MENSWKFFIDKIYKDLTDSRFLVYCLFLCFGKERKLIDIDINASKKIKYYLYIYNDIDKQIREIELDIIDSSSVTVDTWLRGKHCFTNTIEIKQYIFIINIYFNKTNINNY